MYQETTHKLMIFRNALRERQLNKSKQTNGYKANDYHILNPSNMNAPQKPRLSFLSADAPTSSSSSSSSHEREKNENELFTRIKEIYLNDIGMPIDNYKVSERANHQYCSDESQTSNRTPDYDIRNLSCLRPLSSTPTSGEAHQHQVKEADSKQFNECIGCKYDESSQDNNGYEEEFSSDEDSESDDATLSDEDEENIDENNLFLYDLDEANENDEVIIKELIEKSKSGDYCNIESEAFSNQRANLTSQNHENKK
jgi:hypothetical protein